MDINELRANEEGPPIPPRNPSASSSRPSRGSLSGLGVGAVNSPTFGPNLSMVETPDTASTYLDGNTSHFSFDNIPSAPSIYEPPSLPSTNRPPKTPPRVPRREFQNMSFNPESASSASSNAS